MNDDHVLVKKVLQSEIGCFQQLMQKYETRVYTTCFRFVCNEQDARDLTQEVFIKVYNNLCEYRHYSSFSTWLYRICVNTCLDYMKGQKVKTDEIDVKNLMSVDNPENVYQAKELREVIENELNSTTDRDRMIFAFRFLYKMSFNIIGKILDTTSEAARKSYSRTKRKLSDKVESFYRGE